MMRPRVLVMTDYYLPGFKAGGPIRTLSNIIEHLGDEFSFIVLTRDRDLGAKNPYPEIGKGRLCLGEAEVLYMAPGDLTFSDIGLKIRESAPDLIYLNSFFSPYFSIIPMVLNRLGFIPQIPTIISPRGEFALSALKLKSFKKRCYVFFAKLLGFVDLVVWQASGEHEASDIRREFPNAQIVVAPDLPPLIPKARLPKKHAKVQGRLNLVFLSRISPMKNLHTALEILSKLNKGEIVFDIWGPIEDQSYWRKCTKLFASLPENITATYRGEVFPERVHEVFSGYDVFFLPTLGENFGHVILESLGAGLPVLISDRTPWRNLAERCAGWDVALDDIIGFSNVLKSCIDMDARELDLWADGAIKYATVFCDTDVLRDKTASLFLKCLSRGYQTQCRV